MWLEAAHDVAEGATKGNSAIAASGYDVEPETLEAELVTASSPRWEAICADLDVPFRRLGCLVLAFTAEHDRALEDLRAHALEPIPVGRRRRVDGEASCVIRPGGGRTAWPASTSCSRCTAGSRPGRSSTEGRGARGASGETAGRRRRVGNGGARLRGRARHVCERDGHRAAAGDRRRGLGRAAAGRAARAEETGVRLVAGTQALRFTGTSVLLVGVTTVEIEADALVVATGHRPQTMAEAGIAGPRLAGVLPGTVALHLIDHGVVLGRRPLVFGAGGMASEVATRLRRQRVEQVTLVEDRRIVRLEGGPRVEAAWVEAAGGDRERVAADAVVLAHGRLPYRNVDGAVLAAPGVVFAQPGTEPKDGPDVEQAGRDAAARALEAARAPRTAAEPPLRIGGPR